MTSKTKKPNAQHIVRAARNWFYSKKPNFISSDVWSRIDIHHQYFYVFTAKEKDLARAVAEYERVRLGEKP